MHPIERTCLSYWFPKLEAAELPVPKTQIVRAPSDLTVLLDGQKPEGYDAFIEQLKLACTTVNGMPVFLRTGHTSGKHDWIDTCYLRDRRHMGAHVVRLVEESLMGIPGLPTDVWAVREFIPTLPLFTAFRLMPITREFRFFVRNGVVEHRQPYWPPDSIHDANTDVYEHLLNSAAKLTPAESVEIGKLAGQAGAAAGGGYWSVDLLQDRDGRWWITDMADGDLSFKWDPREGK